MPVGACPGGWSTLRTPTSTSRRGGSPTCTPATTPRPRCGPTPTTCGYSSKSGGYRNALSALRSGGLIEGRGDVVATAAGLDRLGRYDPLPTGPALLDWWKDAHLGKAERAIVDVLAASWPAPVPIQAIADQTGYSATSGGFRNALSRLRSLELATGRGELQLNPALLQ